MQERNNHLQQALQRLPRFNRAAVLTSLTGVWLLVVIYDIVTAAWSTPFDQQWVVRLILPLLAIVPAALRIIHLEPIDSEQTVFKAFRSLTVASVIGTFIVALLGILPIVHADNGTPDTFWSFMLGRIAALAMTLLLPYLLEPTVRIFRFSDRGRLSRLPSIYVAAFLGVSVLAQFVPIQIVNEDTRTTIGGTLMALGSLVAFMALLIATRSGWIINLRKEQKWGVVGLAAACSSAAGTMLILIMAREDLRTALLAFAPGLYEALVILFLSLIFTGTVVFSSALLALPTAGAIDRRNIEVSSLANFARLLTQSLSTDDVVDTAIMIARDATTASAAWIELREGEAIQIRLGREPRLSLRAARQLMTHPLGRDHVIAQAVASRRRVEVIDRLRDVGLYRTEMRSELRSLAAAPLQLGEQLLGTLYVARDQAHGFDRRSTILLAALADQIALAIDQSRLIRTSLERERFEQEMLIARDLQERLLPKHMPQSPFYEIYAESLPASLVGGDYFDVVAFSDNTIGVLVADVSGKGASAALYMGMIKGIVQAISGQCASPKDMLSRTNVALHGSIDQRWFATMTCAQIIDEARTLRISRAGHCPSLLIRGGVGSYSTPRGLGLAIARPVLFDGNLEVEEMIFGPGDYAIFFSDGLPEARSPDGEELGYERLMEATVSAATTSPSPRQMRDAIFAEIERFTRGEPLADDSTLVILRWR